MKLYNLIVLVVAFLVSSPLFAADQFSGGSKLPPGFLTNLPPGEGIESPPQPILKDPPVYLDVDSDGNVYRLKLVQDKSGNYQLSNELVTKRKLNKLRSQREVILQNMEDVSLPGELTGQESSASSTPACPLPSSFTIWANSSGEAFGDQKVVNTYRPPGVTTQWLTFDFYTTNYRGSRSHMPITLFHEEIVHGWGGFIGQNSYSPGGCGSSALFNSQIEGWILLPPDRPLGSPVAKDWQSQTFNGPNSCGNEMYDYPIIYNWQALPKYRMEMQASTGHWVAYRILKVNGITWSWDVLTDWKSLDVDGGTWEFYPLLFNSDAQGIFIQATDSAHAGNWSIVVSNTKCGWF